MKEINMKKRNIISVIVAGCAIASLFTVVGCGSKPADTTPTAAAPAPDPSAAARQQARGEYEAKQRAAMAAQSGK